MQKASGRTLAARRFFFAPREQHALRCLLPQGVDHLLVAGRCISGTHEAHSSYRVMPISVATGQAASVCAALAARQGKSPRELPAAQVRRELIKQGADPG